MFGCLSVFRFVHHFWACLRIQDILKGQLYTQQVYQVEKAACRWFAIEKNGLEFRKNAHFDMRLNVAFKCDDHFNVRKVHLTQL